jgi:branched-chain amino acid transport system ATP-binding protein
MLNLPWTRREEQEIRDKAQAMMDLLGIADLSGAEALSLSYGQQRAVELARALASRPTMLLLDEPAAGLNMRETADVANLITRVRNLGITILIVEHDMSLVMNISDEIVVLSYGEKIADDVPRAVQTNPEVVSIYLGEDDA